VDLLPAHANDVLRCTDGTWTVETVCPDGCIVEEPGKPDVCKPFVSPEAYYLPWACGLSYTCTQGNNGTFSHTGKSQYAYDFGMPRQTPVLASRGGVVSHSDNIVGPGDACYDGCSTSACCDACINSGNRVVIDHGDGTSAVYLHLDSAVAAKGATVTTGTLLGYSGTSGCSFGAHLHFQVMTTCGSYFCQSIPMTFTEDPNIVTNSKPVSQNCF
jgi:murein DD-endopeptidase MepM/ murein hydrolase activator NlpD